MHQLDVVESALGAACARLFQHAGRDIDSDCALGALGERHQNAADATAKVDGEAGRERASEGVLTKPGKAIEVALAAAPKCRQGLGSEAISMEARNTSPNVFRIGFTDRRSKIARSSGN